MTGRLFRPPSRFRFAALAIATLGVATLAAAPASAGLFGSDPTPPATIPGQADAAQQAVRLDNMEQQMRTLNGRIEELTHQIEQLQNVLKRAQEDNEFRFQQLEGGKGQKRSEAAPSSKPRVTASTAASAGAGAGVGTDTPMDSVGEEGTIPAGFAIDAPGAVATAQPATDPSLGTPPAPLGTLPGTMAADTAPPSASAVGGPLDLSAIARGEFNPNNSAIATSGGLAAAASQDLNAAGTIAPPAADTAEAPQQMASVAPTTVDPGADYDRAYSSILSGDYAGAEAGFKKFLTDFPGDPRAADAQYWLGESYFSRHQYRDAATSYLATYKNHPTSQKAPDSLFKLGLSLEGLGETSAACATYGELTKKFPKAQAGLVSRVTTQKQKLGCS